jgi:FkbM family methyltransferase
MRLKRFAYKTLSAALRTYWSLTGGRRITAMGESLKVTAGTSFPSHRRLRLPKGTCDSEIVRYAGFVQMHACCRYCAGLPHPPTVVDVGAHHGAYAVVLGKIAQRMDGRVIAVEPNPHSFRTLERNVRLNGLSGTVHIEPIAVTEQASLVPLTLEGSESWVGNGGSAATVDVKGEPLSHLLERHAIAQVDLLIIDVEGAELSVLRSFPWSTAALGKVLCELHPNEWHKFGYGPQDFRDFLKTRDFRCVDMYLQEYEDVPSGRYIGPCCLLPGR